MFQYSAKCITGAVAVVLLLTGYADAQSGVPTAEESDPRLLAWMEGFPPPPEKLITQPDSNYFSFPKLRWTVCHLRELLPTEEVS